MNLAIIGATGNVGRKTIEILEKSKIEISNSNFSGEKNFLKKEMAISKNDK